MTQDRLTYESIIVVIINHFNLINLSRLGIYRLGGKKLGYGITFIIADYLRKE